jgi:hypothetical protein
VRSTSDGRSAPDKEEQMSSDFREGGTSVLKAEEVGN